MGDAYRCQSEGSSYHHEVKGEKKSGPRLMWEIEILDDYFFEMKLPFMIEP